MILSTAEKMKAYREEKRYSIKTMSMKSGCSEMLLKMVENGAVTHPKIAEQIKKAYKLNKKDILEIIPENYRPGPNYDPDKYKAPKKVSKYVIIKRSDAESDLFGYLSARARRGAIR